MKLQNVLQNLIRAKGISITELAKESGIPFQTIHGWTVGKKPTNLSHIKKLANYFGVSLYYLLFEESDPHESLSPEFLKELFSGDIRVTIHKIEKRK